MPDAPTTRKMTPKDDGTVIVPLKGHDPLILDEPSVDELTDIERWIEEADDSLTPLIATSRTIRDMEPGESKDAAQKAIDERTAQIYGEKKHAQTFVAICNLLRIDKGEGIEDVTTGQLYGWALNPTACATLLDHFNRPFGGQSSLDLAQLGPEAVKAMFAAQAGA